MYKLPFDFCTFLHSLNSGNGNVSNNEEVWMFCVVESEWGVYYWMEWITESPFLNYSL